MRDDAEWARFCAATGIQAPPDLATAAARLERREEVERLVEGWTRGRTDAEALTALDGARVPAEAVLSIPEVLDHPQHLHREFFPEIDHPVTGKRRLWITPLRFGRAAVGNVRHAPLFGEDSRRIVREWLDKREAELDALERSGVIGGRPVMGATTAPA